MTQPDRGSDFATYTKVTLLSIQFSLGYETEVFTVLDGDPVIREFILSHANPNENRTDVYEQMQHLCRVIEAGIASQAALLEFMP